HPGRPRGGRPRPHARPAPAGDRDRPEAASRVGEGTRGPSVEVEATGRGRRCPGADSERDVPLRSLLSSRTARRTYATNADAALRLPLSGGDSDPRTGPRRFGNRSSVPGGPADGLP